MIHHMAWCWCVIFICLQTTALHPRCLLQHVREAVLPQTPSLQPKGFLRNSLSPSVYLGLGGNWPDVQSCLLKENPCLGFVSWTDSWPCGMAAVEGLFKLHPGWWVAVRRAVDRGFPTGVRWGEDWAGGTVPLTTVCREEMSWSKRIKSRGGDKVLWWGGWGGFSFSRWFTLAFQRSVYYNS